MIPTRPTSHFVIGQARLALAGLQTIFDPMFGLGHAGEFGQFRFRRGLLR